MSALDAITGRHVSATGPLTLPDAVTMPQAVTPLAARSDDGADEPGAEMPSAAMIGHETIRRIEHHSYLVMLKDMVKELHDEYKALGQLMMQWVPPSGFDVGAEVKSLDAAKQQTAAANQEKVILGALGDAIRVVGAV